MKINLVATVLVLTAVGIAGGAGGIWFAQEAQEKPDKREAGGIARMCAANAGPLVDRADIDFDSASAKAVLSPVSGEPLLYMGQKIEKVTMLSLSTRKARYGCTMYRDAGSGQWAIVPHDYQREMGLE